MISPIQIIALLFVTFAASRAILRAKDKLINMGELLFWLAVWGGLIVVVFFPGIASYFAALVGIGRGVDVIIYTSIALLFYMVFRIYVKIDETERELTKLVREIAIEKKRK